MAYRRKTYHVEQIGVRLTRELHQWLDEKADEQQIPLSVYVRRMIESAARQDLQAVGSSDGDAA